MADGFDVSWGRHAFSGLIWSTRGFQKKLAGLETNMAEDELEDVRVTAPIYVSALARSGTTILLECLADHPAVGTHHYADFPALFTPLWWNRYLELTPRTEVEATERAHKDGIMVTPDSPEAMEEMLWMSFFAQAHDPSRSNLITKADLGGDFDGFYRDHIRKILAVRKRSRYAAKGNYNLARFSYLKALFPDARFIVPVRDPVAHIASLAKQHRLFNAACDNNPRALAHLARVGHFEFGPGRKPIHLGNDQETQKVLDLWAQGREVEGWAHYWAGIHAHIARMRDDEALGESVLVVRYEDLCDQSDATAQALLRHAGLEDQDGFLAKWSQKFHRPNYYKPGFTEAETDQIRTITADAAAAFGYGA